MSGGLRAWGTHQGAVLLHIRWTSFLARLSRCSIQTLPHSLTVRQDTKTEVAEVLTKPVGNQVELLPRQERTKVYHDKKRVCHDHKQKNECLTARMPLTASQKSISGPETGFGHHVRAASLSVLSSSLSLYRFLVRVYRQDVHGK